MTTGEVERFLPQMTAPHSAYEHWHRYLWARRFVGGRRVLDAACGEGYGSVLLAEQATDVIGIDWDAAVIAAARQRYQQANLRFVSGPVERIALADAQFDVIVSFETIEHLTAADQQLMLREFRRLLRPGGRLLLSTPERTLYRTADQAANPFHLHELSRAELTALLGGYFRSVQLLGQRVFPVSYVWPLQQASERLEEQRLALIDGRFREVDAAQKPSLYLLAVCADHDEALPDRSLLIDVTDQAIRQAEDAAAIAAGRLEAESRQLAAMTADRGRALAALAELQQHLDEKNGLLLHLTGLQAAGTADASALHRLADSLAAELQAVQQRVLTEHELLAAARDEAQHALQATTAALTAREQRIGQLMHDVRQLRTALPTDARHPFARRLTALWQRLRAAPRRLAAERRLQRNLIAAAKLLRAPAGLLLFLDTPQADELQSGRLTVRGWVFGLIDDIQRVEVLVDGQPLGRARYGILRTDVYQALAAAPSSAVGYEFSAPIDWADAAVRCTVRVLTAGGGVQQIERYVRTSMQSPEAPIAVEPAEALPAEALPAEALPAEALPAEALQDMPPALHGELEQLRWDGDCLTLAGWLAWPAGGELPLLTLSIGGRPILRLMPDRSRPDRADAVRRVQVGGFSGSCMVADRSGPLQLTAGSGDQPWELTVELPATAADGLTAESAQELRDLLRSSTRRTAVEPAVLVCSDLPLERVLPEYHCFRPPTAGPLPYLPATIAVVVVDDDAALTAEARRVARDLVIRIDRRQRVTAEWLIDDSRLLPSVSIVIAMYNQIAYTDACLAALTATAADYPHYEVIVVDDASTEDTAALRQRWTADARIRFLRNDENCGFLLSSNRGAAAATGEVLVFLNNDTVPQPGWLTALVRVLHEQPDVGAVGGKLLTDDGRLQEAGCLVFNDGSAWNFGKGDRRINAPLYQSLRDVDYCSGALLATHRQLFARIGGFDRRFQPAYYEDVDYCFEVRTRGLRTVYQPEAAVIHHEGISSGTDERVGVKRYQVINRERFIEKWQHMLVQQPLRPQHADDVPALVLGLKRAEVQDVA